MPTASDHIADRGAAESSAADVFAARMTATRRTHFRPPPRLTVSEWADRERKLSPEASAEPGQWNTGRAEYQRAIMDSVNDPAVSTVVAMLASQVGKSEILLNVVGYFIAHHPAPLMIVQPTLEMAEAFSKDRLALIKFQTHLRMLRSLA